MAHDTDPQPAGQSPDVDPQVRAEARRWARAALAKARASYDAEARDAFRVSLGLPPRSAAGR